MNVLVSFFFRSLARRPRGILSAVLLWLALAGAGYADVSITNLRISVDQQPLPSILCSQADLTYLNSFQSFESYRLRAKLITPGYEHHLATKLYTRAEPLALGAAVSGSPRTSVPSELDFFPTGAAGMPQVRLYWVTYTDAAGTQPIFPTGPEVTAYFNIVPTNVLLTSYTTPPAPLPHLKTTEPMSPVFKLRSKVIGVPGFPDGFHAALSWNNQDKELDQSPPPGTWLNQLYWIKYAADGSTITTIGQFLNTTLQVTQGTIALSSTYFKSAQPPAIVTDEVMPENYRLRATFNGTTTTTPNVAIANFSAATSGNNNGFLLDRLPPEGVYTVSLFWEKLDTAGNVVSGGTGPTSTKTVTITAIASPTLTYTGTGEISEGTYTDDDGVEQTYQTGGQYHNFYVPSKGRLTLTTTGPVATYGYLYGPTWNWLGYLQGGGAGGNNFFWTADFQEAGEYRLWIDGNTLGTYMFLGSFVPSADSVSTPVATGANGIKPTEFVANWSMASGDSYELDVSISAYFNSFLFQQRPVPAVRYAVTAGLSPSSNYYYRVRATNTSGAKSAWSAVMQVTTAPSLPTFQDHTNVEVKSAQLSWGIAAGAPQTLVSYSTSATFPIALTTTRIFDNAQPATTTVNNLIPNTAYYYQVASVGQYGALSALPAKSFTTLMAAPVRLALQAWQAGDSPDVVVAQYVAVWVEGSEGGSGWSYNVTLDENFDFSSWDGGMSDLTDPNGNYGGSIPSFYSVSWFEYHDDPSPGYWYDEWSENVVYPDGLYGSSWLTTLGSFHKDEPSSGYSPVTSNRAHLLYPYRVGEVLTFRAWNLVPDANCTSFTVKVYNPANSLLQTASIGTNDRRQVTFTPATNGVYRIEISYSNATHTNVPNATVTYFVAVGPPVIVEGPKSLTIPVAVGGTATFSVVATGMPTYQWRKNGVAIINAAGSVSGATTATLTLSNLAASANNDVYAVVMTNGVAGPVVSSPATLLVGAAAGTAPVITSQPRDVVVVASPTASATFSVVASGSGTLHYQWRKNGAPISGAVDAPSYTVASLQTPSSATYSVVVSNGVVPNATSRAALLIVGTADNLNTQTQLNVYAPLSP